MLIKNALDSAPLRKKIRFGEERLPLVTMWQATGQKLSGLSFFWTDLIISESFWEESMGSNFILTGFLLDPWKEGVFVRTSVSYWYLDEKWLAN